MKPRSIFMPILASVAASFMFCAAFAEERDLERELDQTIVGLLTAKSTLVIIGEPVDYYTQDRYGMALAARFPFKVRVRTVLRGDSVTQGNVLRVGVTRDEVGFRYQKGATYVFFLKADPNKGKSPDPLSRTEWRVVSDYFGVQPYTAVLEKMIRAAKTDE